MAWLGTWAKRIKITIDNTNIDSNLTHFPVPIVLGTSVGQSSQDLSEIFDDLGNNSKKIAITKIDGTTQLYGEIETWDSSTEKAVIHVSKSDWDVLTASTTEAYLYWDATEADNTSFIGVTTQSVAHNVWDGDFNLVCHMAQDPSGGSFAIKDSTSNFQHGTSSGSMTSGDLVDGPLGKAIDFDGSNDSIGFGSGLGLGDINYTLEFYGHLDSKATIQTIIGKGVNGLGGAADAIEYGLMYNSTEDRFLIIISDQTNFQILKADSLGSPSLSTDYYLAAKHIATSNTLNISVNGSIDSTVGTTVIPSASTGDFALGSWDISSGTDRNLAGQESEIRVSSIERSDGWVKATNYALTDNLLTFSATETFFTINIESGVYSITGSPVSLDYGFSLHTEAGSYNITGASVELIASVFLTAEPGAYNITGSSVTLVIPVYMQVDAGSYLISGQDVTLMVPILTAEAGSYLISSIGLDFNIGITPASQTKTVYIFTLTGDQDATTDIEIPIKSIQARLRSATPTYLQVVIPGLLNAADINARSNGLMVVEFAQEVDGEITQRDEIIQANLEDIRIDEGSLNKSITLTGHKQKTFTTKNITMSGQTYKSLTNGAIRYRFSEPNVYLNPGDTVTVDIDTFQANVISYFIGARAGGMTTQMEISEDG